MNRIVVRADKGVIFFGKLNEQKAEVREAVITFPIGHELIQLDGHGLVWKGYNDVPGAKLAESIVVNGVEQPIPNELQTQLYKSIKSDSDFTEMPLSFDV